MSSYFDGLKPYARPYKCEACDRFCSRIKEYIGASVHSGTRSHYIINKDNVHALDVFRFSHLKRSIHIGLSGIRIKLCLRSGLPNSLQTILEDGNGKDSMKPFTI